MGFAAESENLIENAIGKLKRKNLDFIVANSVEYFSKDNNKVFIITKDENIKELDEMPKEYLAEFIVKNIVK